MSSLSVTNLGSIPYSQTAVNIGIIASLSDNYIVESLINGIFTTPVPVACTYGTPIILDNTIYPEDATVLVRVLFPNGSRDTDLNYVTSAQGSVWFQWTNIPVR